MTSKERQNILQAARADAIPRGKSGLWFVTKFSLREAIEILREHYGISRTDRKVTLPPGKYTQLWRLTLSGSMNLPFPADLVMQDTPDELETHLDFMLRAHGHVLITGLGLGCVARGCLANPNVKSVTVIEQDSDVLRLVRPYLPPRIQIIRANAVAWIRSKGNGPALKLFDCAWHDLWSDPDDEKAAHLQVMHSDMISHSLRHIPLQGAWQLPRWFKHSLRGVI